MRIIVFSNQAFSLVNFRGSLIRQLVESKHQVFALAPDFTPAIRNQLTLWGAHAEQISLNRTGLYPLRDIYDLFLLTAKFKQLQADIVLCYTVKPVIYGNLAAWLARIRVRIVMIEGLGYVFTPSGCHPGLGRRLLIQIVRFLYWTSLSVAQSVIFLNKDDAREFVADRLVRSNKVKILGGIGVDLKEWSFIPPFKSPTSFAMVARLLREKGIIEFVAAARLVKSLYPSVKFVLLGGLDDNPGSLDREEIEGWVAEGLIEWPGHVDVKAWLALASVFVLPSYREGVPRSTQEAMAIGRAVITTDVPGCRDTVVEGVNGFLVPPRDELALANAMLNFVENPSLVESMGLESRRLAEERFDVVKADARLMAIMGVD
jgi:glycosyltransferase involved in cell wall biosynthesis